MTASCDDASALVQTGIPRTRSLLTLVARVAVFADAVVLGVRSSLLIRSVDYDVAAFALVLARFAVAGRHVAVRARIARGTDANRLLPLHLAHAVIEAGRVRAWADLAIFSRVGRET